MWLFRPIIKEKADEYAKSLGNVKFNASNGWLDKLKKCHRIMERTIWGESADESDEDCDQWKQGFYKSFGRLHTW